MAYRNILEPEKLIKYFLDNPPDGFKTQALHSGGITFTARFDLSTTLEGSWQKRLRALPGAQHWLHWHTMFYGSTVNEYSPFPDGQSPKDLLQELLEGWQGSTELLIIKDIPHRSELLSSEDNAYADVLSEACQKLGFVLIEGQALAWVPVDYADEDDYLSHLSSGRRRDLRRKLRSRKSLQLDILNTGDPIFNDKELLAEIYALYLEAYNQSELHFDLLSPEFFRALLQDSELRGVLFRYRREGQLIGYNLCFEHKNMLIDKYFGARYPAAREVNLYFISWFENLRYARECGLEYYVAGWTDPVIKSYLGARFTFTRHAVYVRRWWLRSLFGLFSSYFESDSQTLSKAR